MPKPISNQTTPPFVLPAYTILLIQIRDYPQRNLTTVWFHAIQNYHSTSRNPTLSQPDPSLLPSSLFLSVDALILRIYGNPP